MHHFRFAKRAWKKGRCKNGWDYCKIYLASDLLTLLDILCKNTHETYGEFGLDLGYYFSTPHLVMDLILKISKEEIGLITDVDQHLFVERLMRRGSVFHGVRILKTDSTEQNSTVEKSAAVFFGSVIPLPVGSVSLMFAVW